MRFAFPQHDDAVAHVGDSELVPHPFGDVRFPLREFVLGTVGGTDRERCALSWL